MTDEYLIVSKNVLPDYLPRVVDTRELLRSGKASDICEAVRMTGISRSTYYKYKDSVFPASQGDTCRKAIIAMMLHHHPGILSAVLNVLSENGANILTISQNPPIGTRASVVVSIDIDGLECSIADLLEKLAGIEGVDRPNLIDIS